MKTAKKNTIVYVRNFSGHPLVRCTLKGVWYSNDGHMMYVIKPLETNHGYVANRLDTCYSVVPAVCCRWLNKGLRFAPKPFNIDHESLPVFENHDFS